VYFNFRHDFGLVFGGAGCLEAEVGIVAIASGDGAGDFDAGVKWALVIVARAGAGTVLADWVDAEALPRTTAFVVLIEPLRRWFGTLPSGMRGFMTEEGAWKVDDCPWITTGEMNGDCEKVDEGGEDVVACVAGETTTVVVGESTFGAEPLRKPDNKAWLGGAAATWEREALIDILELVAEVVLAVAAACRGALGWGVENDLVATCAEETLVAEILEVDELGFEKRDCGGNAGGGPLGSGREGGFAWLESITRVFGAVLTASELNGATESGRELPEEEVAAGGDEAGESRLNMFWPGLDLIEAVILAATGAAFGTALTAREAPVAVCYTKHKIIQINMRKNILKKKKMRKNRHGNTKRVDWGLLNEEGETYEDW
jgi:hypothetical protein